MNDNVRLTPNLSWMEGLFVMYRAQQYGIAWSEVVGGIIREFAVADRKNVDFKDLAKFVLDSPRLKDFPGDKLLTVLSDIEVLSQIRESDDPYPVQTTTPPFSGQKRRTDWAVGTISFGISLLDNAILEYYGSRLDREPPIVLRMLVSLYMVADQRLRMDEFEKFVDEASGQVSEEDQQLIEEYWQGFLDKRLQCQKKRRRNKIKKAS